MRFGHEIERYENEISKLEDQELELMIEADKLKGELEAADKSARATKTASRGSWRHFEIKSKALETDRTDRSEKRLRLKSTRTCRPVRAPVQQVKAMLRSSPSSTVFAPVAT